MVKLFIFFRIGVLLLFFCVFGCVSRQKVVYQDGMSVMVDFRDVHICSRISPEIVISNIPHDTVFYDVRLMEGDKYGRFLGGGSWIEDGTGVIPEGALTKYYVGPCPSKGGLADYVYVVAAMGENNTQPLAVSLFNVDFR